MSCETKARTRARRYTLVLHPPIMPGWQIIEYKRVRCSVSLLERYCRTRDVHFVIDGWPNIQHPDGTPIKTVR